MIKVAKKGANVFRTARCNAIPGVNHPCTLLDPRLVINIASSKKYLEATNVASEVKITMGYRNITKSAKLIYFKIRNNIVPKDVSFKHVY